MIENKVNKPWGYYVDYFRNESVAFKKIVVAPNEKLSYQYHSDRDEFWYVVSGTGILIVNDDETYVGEGSSVLIKKEEKHTVKCVAPKRLVIYEMQVGRPSEDDIVRLEDKYGRN